MMRNLKHRILAMLLVLVLLLGMLPTPIFAEEGEGCTIVHVNEEIPVGTRIVATSLSSDDQSVIQEDWLDVIEPGVAKTLDEAGLAVNDDGISYKFTLLYPVVKVENRLIGIYGESESYTLTSEHILAPVKVKINEAASVKHTLDFGAPVGVATITSYIDLDKSSTGENWVAHRTITIDKNATTAILSCYSNYDYYFTVTGNDLQPLQTRPISISSEETTTQLADIERIYRATVKYDAQLGTVSLDGKTVQSGETLVLSEDLRLTATATANYHGITKVLLGDTEVTPPATAQNLPPKTYIIDLSAYDIASIDQISITFSRYANEQELLIDGMGTVKNQNQDELNSGIFPVTADKDHTLYFEAATEWVIQSLTVNDQALADAVGQTTYTLRYSGRRQNTIHVVFVEKTYPVTYSIGANGTVDVENEGTDLSGQGSLTLGYKLNDQIPFIIRAKENYHIASLLINGAPVMIEVDGKMVEKVWTRDDASYEGILTVGREKNTIEVTFAENIYSYSIHVKDENYGSAYLTEKSGNLILSLVPGDRCHLVSIQCRNGITGEVTSLDLSQVVQDPEHEDQFILTIEKPKYDAFYTVTFEANTISTPDPKEVNATQGVDGSYTVSYDKELPVRVHIVEDGAVVNGKKYDRYYVLVKDGTKVTFAPQSPYRKIELKTMGQGGFGGDYRSSVSFTVKKNQGYSFDEINLIERDRWSIIAKTKTERTPMIFLTDDLAPTLEILNDPGAPVYTNEDYIVNFKAAEEADDLSKQILSSGLDYLKYSIQNVTTGEYVKQDATVKFDEQGNTVPAGISINAPESGHGTFEITAIAYDKAGNASETRKLTVTISTLIPEISIDFKNAAESAPVEYENDLDWYQAVEAVITVKDPCFDAAHQQYARKVLVDIELIPQEHEALVWKQTEDKTGYYTTVALADGEYIALATAPFRYTNIAGNSAELIQFSRDGDPVPCSFGVDSDAPDAKVRVGEANTWDTLATALTFGLFYRQDNQQMVQVCVEEENLAALNYVKLPGAYVRENGLDQLDGLQAWLQLNVDQIQWTDATADWNHFAVGTPEGTELWMDLTGFTEENEEMVVLVAVIDKANNTTYCSTDGLMLDSEAPTMEMPIISETEEGVYVVTFKCADKAVAPSLTAGSHPLGGEFNTEKEYPILSGVTHLEITREYMGQTESIKMDYSELMQMTIDSAVYDAGDVRITVAAVDAAGNRSATRSITLDTHPAALELTSDRGDRFEGGYYQSLTAKVIITEERAIFDAQKVHISLIRHGELGDEPILGEHSWSASEVENTIDNKNVCLIPVLEEGYYTLTVKYNGMEEIRSFYIDTTAPQAAVEFEEQLADRLLRAVTFDAITNQNLLTSALVSDNYGIASLQYYKAPFDPKNDSFAILSEEELEMLSNEAWQEVALSNGQSAYELFEVSEDEAFVVYLKVVDLAGNVTYCNTKSVAVVDKEKPKAELHVGENTWNSLVSAVTFGLFSRETLEVSATIEDSLSGVETVEYLIQTKDEEFTNTEEILGQWIPVTEYALGESFAVCTLDQSGPYVVYLRVIDRAKNVQIVNSEGMVYDNSILSVDFTAEDADPENASQPPVEGEKIFNGDVKLSIATSETVLGIQSVILHLPVEGAVEDVILFQYEIVEENGQRYARVLDRSKPEGEQEYTIADPAPQYSQLQFSWTGSFVVPSGEFNLNDMPIGVTVTDNSGAQATTTKHISIDTDAPVVKLSYSDSFVDEEQNAPKNGFYYRGDRTLRVEVAERASNFDPTTIELNLSVKNKKGEELKNAEGELLGELLLKDIRDPANWKSQGDIHSYEYAFSVDGIYTFSELEEGAALYIRMKDKANNSNQSNSIEEGCINVAHYVLDKEPMTASLFSMDRTWDTLLSIFTFGLFSQNEEEVTGLVSDTISPLDKAYYYVSDGADAVPEKVESWTPVADMERITDDESFPVTTLEKNSKNVVYLAVMDRAGNLTKITSDGMIIDDQKPVLQGNAIAVSGGAKDYYNHAVKLDLHAADAVAEDGSYSGIAKVEIKILDTVTKYEETHELYSYEILRNEDDTVKSIVIKDSTNGDSTIEGENLPSFEQLKATWAGQYTVTPGFDTFNHITEVTLLVTDMAGNIQVSAPFRMEFDLTAPEIHVTYNETEPVRYEDGVAYFAHSRSAVITIFEREGRLDLDRMEELLKLSYTAKDRRGNAVADAKVEIDHSQWRFVENVEDPDQSYYSNQIHFLSDANYQITEVEGYENALGFAVSDAAGNPSAEVVYDNSTEPAVKYNYSFTVDTTAPTGSLTMNDSITWSTFLNVITFGLYEKVSPSVTAKVDDLTSPIDPESVYYLITDGKINEGGIAPTLDELLKQSWTKAEGLDLSSIHDNKLSICKIPEYTHVVYLQFKDYAGNRTVISTDGVVVDFVKPEVKITAPNADESFIYNSDVTLKLWAGEPENAYDSYSGLASVDYYVMFPNSTQWVEPAGGSNLFTFSYDKEAGQQNPYREQLVQTVERTVVLDTARYNFNNLKIKLVVKDNAGHTNEVIRNINIDSTLPQITVSYDNNTATNDTYFKDQRTATITVRERNFDPAKFVYSTSSSSTGAPRIGQWREVRAGSEANLDDRTYETKIVFSADSDYRFSLGECTLTDKAGNRCAGARFVDGTVAGESFTVDKTVPVITVTYDNNEVENGKYYKAYRTATVTIQERNFRDSLVNVSLTATLDGKGAEAPKVSAWNRSGDAFTATIHYNADAEYSFDIALQDLAGNASADYAKESFVIDTTAPVLEISGVEHESANSGAVAPVVSYSDLNLDEKNTKLSLNAANRGEFDHSHTTEEIEHGLKISYENFPEEKDYDDIYVMKAVVTDMAGNVTEQAVEFSINRFGSTYEIDEATQALNGTYAQEAGDVVISEVNANELSEIEVTLYRNNETYTLVEGKDYEILVEGGEGNWYKYTYRIFSENFAEDGNYRVAVHSKDQAGNVAENSLDTKNMDINFGIDRTKPSITLGNLQNGKTYPVELFTANMLVNDNLKLDQVIVYLDGTEWASWDAAKIMEILSGDGEFTFDIDDFSNNAHEARIYARDAAGNEQELTVEDFYVTTNPVVRYYNNKPLFYGSIGGGVGLIGLLIILLAKRKKKDNNA
ncbi:MAG: Ig-like domain repeat protein [Oscillospiraceae bacterium]|nr:Ig-like domain repeat protein [Oscillospiraceae bacterium]